MSQVSSVKHASSADDAIEFLLELERTDRNSLKRVVLDCPATMAKVQLLNFEVDLLRFFLTFCSLTGRADTPRSECLPGPSKFPLSDGGTRVRRGRMGRCT